MNTMKRILTVALVAAMLGGALWSGAESIKVRGCKPVISPRSSGDEVADNGHRDRRYSSPPVAAVRG
ncbi:MAG TPA: hypothetical protein VJB14_18490 [Planctomycetota bacterium]|nr:hypothetical protein [Planctomycetota bacterium]